MQLEDQSGPSMSVAWVLHRCRLYAAPTDGYCPSKSEFVWGMRLVLISDAKGVPVGYDLTGPTTGQERERALELAAAHAPSTLFADKAFRGKEYRDCMELIDIRLITPERHRSGARAPIEIAKARIRLATSPLSSRRRPIRHPVARACSKERPLVLQEAPVDSSCQPMQLQLRGRRPGTISLGRRCRWGDTSRGALRCCL